MWFWLSSNSITVLVEVESGKIIHGPPITSKFKGQPLVNLIKWMKTQGGFKINALTEEKDVL